MFFIVGWIACIEILNTRSEEQNNLAENIYGTGHIVSSVPSDKDQVLYYFPHYFLFHDRWSSCKNNSLLALVGKKKKR